MTLLMRLRLIDPIVYSPAVMKRLIILEQKKLRVMKYEHCYLITDWPQRVVSVFGCFHRRIRKD